MAHFLLRFSIPVLLLSLACFFATCATPPSRPALDHPNLRRFNDHQINQIIITAWEHFSKKNFESAALDFERLIKKDYSDDDILFGAAISHYYTANKKKALEYCSAAIEKNPLHFEALYLRANLHQSLGRLDAARKDFKALASMEFEKDLVCGYYFHDNDLAGKKAFEEKKSQALAALQSL